MAFYLQVQCASTFDKIIKKRINMTKYHISKGLVKIYKDNKDNPSTSSDKSCLWKKKNFVNNGEVDTKPIPKIL